MKWKILDTGTASAESNMEIDAQLLKQMHPDSDPILHLYEWKDKCATFGHFIDPYKYLDKNHIEKESLKLAKRPTGGGIIFHLSDFAFSLLVPANHSGYSVNTKQNYVYVHNIIAKVIKKACCNSYEPYLLKEDINQYPPGSEKFCMAKPTINDVMIDGVKVAGGAQRRTKCGFLHQGSIFLGNSIDLSLYLEKSHRKRIQDYFVSGGSFCLDRKEIKAFLIDLLCKNLKVN